MFCTCLKSLYQTIYNNPVKTYVLVMIYNDVLLFLQTIL